MQKAIYGFSGDPITKGHIDIIERALAVFGELTIGIGVNPAKKYFFSHEERKNLAEESLKYLSGIKVIAFKGLLVDYAYENNIKTVIRGIRNSEDLNYELMLYQIGESQKLGIDTVFFPARQQLMHISSGAAKALQIEQGLIHQYVPLCVKQKLEERLSKQFIISITGQVGSGKSFISRQFEAIGKSQGLMVHHIDIDRIGHQILGELTESLYQSLRTEIANQFGAQLQSPDGFIDRKALGKIIFSDQSKLQQFNNLIYKPLILRLRRELYGKKGLIILDSALIAESDMSYLSNNNIILVEVDSTVQNERLVNRGYTQQQIINRLNSQYTIELKEEMIKKSIEANNYGTLWRIENSIAERPESIQQLFTKIISDLSILS